MSDKKKKKEQDKVKWDTRKHDERVAREKEKDEVGRQKVAMQKCYILWNDFKGRMVAKKRTPEEVMEEMHKVMSNITGHLDKCSEAYRDMTLDLFADGISKAIATDFGKHGSIHQFVPDGALTTPQTIQFDTQDELESIPWVAAFKVQEGFIGFCLDLNRLLALYLGANVMSDLPIVGSIILPKNKREKMGIKYPLLSTLVREYEQKMFAKN